MYYPTVRIKPVVECWLEQDIGQWADCWGPTVKDYGAIPPDGPIKLFLIPTSFTASVTKAKVCAILFGAFKNLANQKLAHKVAAVGFLS